MSARDKINEELARIKRDQSSAAEWDRIRAQERAQHVAPEEDESMDAVLDNEEINTDEPEENVKESDPVSQPAEEERIRIPKTKGKKKAGPGVGRKVEPEPEIEDLEPEEEPAEYTGENNMQSPADMDQDGAKSEIAKQLFDIPRNKILQRTELPRRMILPMSMMKTAIYLTTPYSAGKETGPEHWMNEYGYLMLSAGRKIRIEGMSAFQPVMDGGSQENINF